VFLLVAAGGFTQTKTFRSYIRSLAIEELQKVLDGTIDFGVIEGNLATGLEINNIVLAKDGREIFYAERLEARYDPGSILLQRLKASRLTLIRPRIHLWRGLDGDWNVDRLLLPNEQADTTSSPWTIDAAQVELQEATVEMIDSLALSRRTADAVSTSPANAIDYARVTLTPPPSGATCMFLKKG
jgi:uncharacterized protein involved in outer membrane biogenesis